MHPVSLISSALEGAPDAPEIPAAAAPGLCCVTGEECLTVSRRELFGPSFTDGALLRAPHSDRVGIEAYRALAYKWERMSSWLCDGATFRRLDRQGVRAAVLGEAPLRPWAGYATTSYKKHGAMRARVNAGGKRVWLFETRLVDCSDRALVTDTWGRLNAALRGGIPRPVIEDLAPSPHLIRQAGADVWLAFEAWARPRHRSALYAFLTYLLPSQEELRAEGVQRPAARGKAQAEMAL